MAMRLMKGQMMSILVLLMFLLMLATLFTFAMLSVSNNQIEQSLSLASGTGGYASLLKLSANNFVRESASKALQVLANYEYAPGLREDNFITNLSAYIAQLMINGTLPNETQEAISYTVNAMGNLTFAEYNGIIANTLGFSTQNLTINETRPLVFQTSPYYLNVAYVENIGFTAAYSTYHYSIPVNVSIPLNGTPDLLYAQRGIMRNIRFASLSNLTSVIGNAHAVTGNYIGIAYGTILALPSNSVSGASCPSSTPLPTSDMIIATYNAIGLESCMNSYAGLIAYIPPTSTPTVPYLIYSSSTNILQQLPTGRKVLIYGPELATLNIENLKNAISNGYYFASPFTPSYTDRASWNIMKSSPNGIFTFTGYHTKVAQFNGNGEIVTKGGYSAPTSLTIAGWFYSSTFTNNYQFPIDSNPEAVWRIGFNSANDIYFDPGSHNDQVLSYAISFNKWYFVAFTATDVGSNTLWTFYVNGVPVGSGSVSSTIQPVTNIGLGDYADTFTGELSNVQIYNTTLSPGQLQTLYQEGITGRPIPNAGLVGWWPLDGNANDYSGFGNNGTATNVAYVSPLNYTRDSIFMTTTPKTKPLPGIMSCTSNANCNSNSMANLYISNLPLENKNPELVGYFGPSTSDQIVVNHEYFQGNSFTILAWVFWPSGVNLPSPSGTSDLGYAWSGPSTTDEGFGIFSRNDHWYLNFYDDDLECSDGPVNGKWYQFGASWNSSTKLQTIWVNGAANCTRTSSGNLITNSPIYIGSGAGTWDGSAYMDGNVSNIQIYNVALPQSQIQKLYQEGIYGAPIQIQNLTAWWPLDGNANDYSGFGNNGTATNVAYLPMNGTYTAPGLSSITGIEDEPEVFGFVG